MTTMWGIAADEVWHAPLTSGPHQASVTSSFTHALNLRLGEQPLSLLTEDAGQAPNALLVRATSFPRVPPGTVARVGNGQVLIGTQGWLIDAAHRTGFSCRVAPGCVQFRMSAASIATFEAAFDNVARTGSFVAGPQKTDFEHAMRGWLRRAASAYQTSLADILGASQFERTQVDRLGVAVRDLVGLGVGLTPSGDDYLVGSLAVLHQLRSHPGVVALLQELLTPALVDTTEVSAAYLAAAADGRFHADLRRVAASALRAEDTDLVVGFEAVARLGATSGTDVLRGLIDTLSTLAAVGPRPPLEEHPRTLQGVTS